MKTINAIIKAIKKIGKIITPKIAPKVKNKRCVE